MTLECGYTTVSEKSNVIYNTNYFKATPRKSWCMRSYEKSQPLVKLHNADNTCAISAQMSRSNYTQKVNILSDTSNSDKCCQN